MRPNKTLNMLLCTLLFTLAFSAPFALAAENEEIDFLLAFVAESECTFIRNGKEHQGPDASEHLAMKYNHVKSRIKTADIFIDKIATKSSFSGRQYEVQCGNEKIPTKRWLENALASYRAPALNSE